MNNVVGEQNGTKKSRFKKSKVVPYSKLKESETGVDMELDSIVNEKDNNRKSIKMNKFKTTASASFGLLANVQHKASKWRRYTNQKRQLSKTGRPLMSGNDDEYKKMGGLGLDDIHEQFTQKESRSMVVSSNRALIQEFAKLGPSTGGDVAIDLDFVENLLNYGAKIDCTDKYGQTVFHEIARTWHIDVARFFLEHGANINAADHFGRTPLHVAAAVDYPEMVTFLIQNGADKEARTKGEEQTPVYFAARNDACKSLKRLIQLGCEYKTIRDYKGRTPLHVAAELDRSETARLLLELNAPAGVTDNCGQAAIVWMITKMGPVAKEALDQFHIKDRANRKQYFYINHVEPNTAESQRIKQAMSPLETAVQQKQYDILLHPVINRLIKIKWQNFARLSAWVTLLINLLFIVVWTLIAMTTKYDKRHLYTFPQDWWRVLLWIFAVGIWIYQIVEEVLDIIRSNKKFKHWRKWRLSEIDRDMKFTHPRWPEEEEFLQCEKKEVDKGKPQYFSDFWNIFDWICYALLLTTIVTHIVDVAHHTEFLARLHIRIQAFNIIILWLRLMKNARAFAALGPFIVMLGHMLGDVVKFVYLYMEFFIPFSCAFWMIFGGPRYSQQDIANGITNTTQTVMVSGLQNFETAFTMFRLTLVDEYDFDNMLLVDDVMTYLLLIGWFGLSSILCLNLFIALLSDTFQRVYDNAHANALMQKAITILSIQDGRTEKQRETFNQFIRETCSPEKLYYDDDLTTSGEDDLKKATIQIRDDIEELKDWWKDEFHDNDSGSLDGDFIGGDGRGSHRKQDAVSVVSQEQFQQEMEAIRDEMNEMKSKQEEMFVRFKKDCFSMKALLFQIAAYQGVPGIPQSSIGSQSMSATDTRSAMEDWEKLEKKRRRDYRLAKKAELEASEHKTVTEVASEHVTETGAPPSNAPPADAPPPVFVVEHQEPRVEVYPSAVTTDRGLVRDTAPVQPDVDVYVRPTVLNMEKMPDTDC